MKTVAAVVLVIASAGNECGSESSRSQAEIKDRQAVSRQQEQYAASQPIPAFDWSLERHLAIELYRVRNSKALTHSVWRGDTSIIEGDCPSIGYGIPYDTSLTNPLQPFEGNYHGEITTIGQAEPNGVFASQNTSATWVMCAGNGGQIEPVYVEGKVTVYPWKVYVDYKENLVERTFEGSTVTINPNR